MKKILFSCFVLLFLCSVSTRLIAQKNSKVSSISTTVLLQISVKNTRYLQATSSVKINENGNDLNSVSVFLNLFKDKTKFVFREMDILTYITMIIYVIRGRL